MERFCCWLSTGMDILKRLNIYVLIFLSLYGMVLGQYMQCPAEDWTVGFTTTLRCYLPKDIYPTRCTNAFTDVVTFYKTPRNAANTKCTLSSVSNSSCSSSSSGCSCESGNATHYSLQSTFTVDTEDAGTWVCTVRCVDANFNGQLTYTAVNCDDRDVVADVCFNETCNDHGTCNRTTNGTCDCDPGYEGENCNSSIPADTTQPPTPAIRDCDFCECCDCEDTGGCWKCILMICIIIVLPPLCISIYCCCCCCFCYCCCREKTKKRLERIYKRIDKFVARCLCKKKNQDKGPSDKPVDSTGVEPEAPHPPLLLHLRTIPQDKSDHKPTNPNGPKRGKQIAEKSDMNELRDIPSSPDQYERSHPAKGSRDLPQPRAGGGGQVNVTHSSTPRSLLPVQAVTPLPSVERNSYAESRKLPLPSIDSKDAH